ncbi:DUF916 and DUF3324 domain-containing protein [Levilactobacillus bambusae]|nr:DUF916 and DUF3324 domain-containing protein [Levilactobacillus bambusae]
MTKKGKWLAAVALLVGFTLPTTALAAKDQGNQPGGFQVQAEIPKNQIDKKVTTYYDLKVKPNESGTLYLNVQNQLDKTATYKIALNPAFTSNAGAITYNNNSRKLDPSMPFNLRNYATVSQQNLTLKAGQGKRIAVKYRMPNKPFNGIVLGGVTVTKNLTDADKKNNIRNQVSYSVATEFQESTQPVKSALVLNSVKASANNAEPTVELNIQNPMSKIESQLKLKTTIYKGDKKLLVNNSTRTMQIAPNTNMTYMVRNDNHRMEPGSYKAVIDATTKGGHWHWVRHFTVTQKQASQINNNSYFPQKTPWYETIWFFLSIIALLLLIIVVLLYHRYRKNRSQGKHSRD